MDNHPIFLSHCQTLRVEALLPQRQLPDTSTWPCVCVCVVSGYITLTLVRGSTSGSASTLAMSSHSMMPYENTSAYRTFIIKISSDNSVWS